MAEWAAGVFSWCGNRRVESVVTFVLMHISQLCTSHAEYSSRMSSLHSKEAVACMRYTKSSFLKTWGLDRALRPPPRERQSARARAHRSARDTTRTRVSLSRLAYPYRRPLRRAAQSVQGRIKASSASSSPSGEGVACNRPRCTDGGVYISPRSLPPKSK